MSFISNLSQQYGLDEAGIRFLLGQMSGYPLFLLYSLLIRKSPSLFTHYLYIISTGVFVAYWSFGLECLIHGMVCIILNHLVLTFGPFHTQTQRFKTTTFAVVVQFLYLLAGYWNRQKWGEYDAAIDWTTPHCVLCLRLMSIGMDYYDGKWRYDVI